MAKNNKNSWFATWFNKYRHKDNQILTVLENIEKRLNELEGIDNFEKKDIVESSLLNPNKELKSLFDNVQGQRQNAQSTVSNLKNSIREELSETNKHFENLEVPYSESINRFRLVAMNYNHKQHDYISQLSTQFNSIKKLHDELIAMEDVTFKEFAEKIVQEYNNLENLIKNDSPNKFDIYYTFEKCMLAIKNSWDSMGYVLEQVKGLQNSNNARIFVKNIKSKETILRTFNQIYTQLGREKDNEENTYQAIESENTTPKEKDLKDIIKKAFKGIHVKVDKGEEEVEKLIDKVIKIDEDMKELKERFKEQLSKLKVKLSDEKKHFKVKDLAYNIRGTGINDFKIPLENGETKTIGEINKKEYLDEESNKEELKHITQTLEDGLKNKSKTFDHLIKINEDLFDTEESKGSNNDYKEYIKNNKDEIKKSFEDHAEVFRNFLNTYNQIDDKTYQTELDELKNAVNFFKLENTNINKDEDKKDYFISVIKEVFKKDINKETYEGFQTQLKELETEISNRYDYSEENKSQIGSIVLSIDTKLQGFNVLPSSKNG